MELTGLLKGAWCQMAENALWPRDEEVVLDFGGRIQTVELKAGEEGSVSGWLGGPGRLLWACGCAPAHVGTGLLLARSRPSKKAHRWWPGAQPVPPGVRSWSAAFRFVLLENWEQNPLLRPAGPCGPMILRFEEPGNGYLA